MAACPYVLEGVSDVDAVRVLANLRQDDIYEAEAFGLDATAVAPAIIANAKDRYTAFLTDDHPAFIFGTWEIMPAVRQLFGFGTPKTKRVIPNVTWFTNTYWLPELFESGVRRIQVHVPKESRRSVAWLKSFGMYVECEMAGYSANDSTMLQLAFTQKEFETNVLGQQKQLTSGHSAARATAS